MKRLWEVIKRHKILVSSLATFIIVASVLSVQIGYVPKNGNISIGQGQVVITIGDSTYASGTVDYICDGTDDNIQFQGALDALPNAGGVVGGEIQILSGNYDFQNGVTVTRAIANVTIRGVGRGSYITCDGATAIFTAGGNNWTIRDLRTDAGSLAMGATTGWSWENVTINATYYAYQTDDATTASSWNIPTGRTATYVIAASNATALEKAQADIVVTGNADDEIQAGLNLGNVTLTSGTFTISVTVVQSVISTTLSGQGWNTIIKAVANLDDTIIEQTARFCIIQNLRIDGNKANVASGIGIHCFFNGNQRGKISNVFFSECETGVKLGGVGGTNTMDDSVENCQFENNEIAVDEGNYGGWILKGYYAASSKVYAIKIDGVNWSQVLGGRSPGASGTNANSIYIHASTNVQVEGCDIDGMGNNGILIDALDANSSDIQIIGNQITQCSYMVAATDSGIKVLTDGSNTVVGLTITGNSMPIAAQKYSIEIATVGVSKANITGNSNMGACDFTGVDKTNSNIYGNTGIPDVTFDTSPNGRGSMAGETFLVIPGVSTMATATIALIADTIYYFPIRVDTAITIDKLYAEVTSAGAGGTLVRMGLYNANTSWQPTTLVIDAGTIAADSATVQSVNAAVTLPAGRYLMAMVSNGTPTMRSVRGGGDVFGYKAALGAAPYPYRMIVAKAYAVLATPGTVWTSADGSGTPMHYAMFLSVTTP